MAQERKKKGHFTKFIVKEGEHVHIVVKAGGKQACLHLTATPDCDLIIEGNSKIIKGGNDSKIESFAKQPDKIINGIPVYYLGGCPICGSHEFDVSLFGSDVPRPETLPFNPNIIGYGKCCGQIQNFLVGITDNMIEVGISALCQFNIADNVKKVK